MGEIGIMEAVRAFVRLYPPLAGNKINVDFLPEDARSYSVEGVPGKEILRTYTDGSTVRQFLFVLASRENYGKETLQQLENLGFYEDFSDWLSDRNIYRELPELGQGRKVLRIEATTGGYALTTAETSARYQIQCRMEYIEQRKERE